MSRISLQMYTMREHTKTKEDFEQTVAQLAEIGLSNLQYSVPGFITVEEVRTIFDRYGIREDSIFCPIPRIRENLKEILHQSEVLDTKWLRLDSMPATLTPGIIEMWAHYLNELGALLAPHGIRMMYHFHSFEFINFPGQTGMDIFLRETNPEYVYIQPDTHWIASGGQSPAEYLEAIRDRIHYVHVKDYAIGVREKQLESTPVLFAPVGEGNLNWKNIFHVCENFQNEMYVIEQDNCYGRDPFDCVASSFRFLRANGIE